MEFFHSGIFRIAHRNFWYRNFWYSATYIRMCVCVYVYVYMCMCTGVYVWVRVYVCAPVSLFKKKLLQIKI